MAFRVPGAVALIAAVARNGVIGANNALPWKLPADLARLSSSPSGHGVAPGRKTWQSLGRPLKHRQNIVVTRDPSFAAEGADIVASFTQALDRCTMPAPAFCIGGGQLYAEAIPLATVMHLTEIDRDFEGDARFPAFDRDEWRIESREEHVTDDGMRYAFVTYQRTGEQ
jgi:dihydrofolate reductase